MAPVEVEAWVAPDAMIGVRALLDRARRRIVLRARPPQLAGEVRA